MPRRTALLVALQSHPLRRKRGLPVLSQNPLEDDQTSHVVPISQERFYKKITASGTSTSKKTTDSPAVFNRDTLTVGSLLRKEDAHEQQLDDGEEVDSAIEEKFYLGLNYVKEDWKRQGKLIENLQKEVVSMRTKVSKTTCLPVEVRKAGNDVSGLVQNVNTFGADFVELRANMLGVTEHV